MQKPPPIFRRRFCCWLAGCTPRYGFAFAWDGVDVFGGYCGKNTLLFWGGCAMIIGEFALKEQDL